MTASLEDPNGPGVRFRGGGEGMEVERLLSGSPDVVCMSTSCRKSLAALKTEQRQVNPSIVRIGFQIRAPFQAPSHFYCIDRLLERFAREPLKREVILLLVSSSYEIQVQAKQRYGETLILPEGEPYNVTTVHDRDPPTSREEALVLDRQAMLDAARDFFLMSMTDVKVVSDASGFGLVSSILRPQRKYTILGVDVAGRAERNCSAALDHGGDPLSKFAHWWSGLR